MDAGDAPMEAAARHVVRLAPLFGGAMSMSLATRFQDMSEFRQIPDNQEVFADPITDQSVIIELLSLQEEAGDDAAAEFHFGSIAQDNEATQAALDFGPVVRPLPEGGMDGFVPSCGPQSTPIPPIMKIVKPSCCTFCLAGHCRVMTLCSGTQVVAKFREGAGRLNTIRVHVACWRIRGIATDIVLSYNTPLWINNQSSSGEMVDVAALQEDAVAARVEQEFEAIASSIAIHDVSLFDPLPADP